MPESPFPVRGALEGFYGTFYTFPQRNDLIQFIGAHGYNLYIYGPKNDRQHRQRWWESYPTGIMDQFAETVQTATNAGVRFCYAISPLNYDPTRDFPKLTRKIGEMYAYGVRDFSLFVDDLQCAAHHRTYCKLCPWPADVDIAVCNGLYEWLIALDPACTLSMCPTEYHGRAPFNTYLHDLGAGLHPAIDIFYTGPDVCSPDISTADAQQFAQAVQRPPLIWDNYPVNDLAMRPYMHIGPIRDREATLYEAVRGIVVNLMLQPEASKIPLLTWSEYMRDPHSYDPWTAWERALKTVGGATSDEALRHFADNSLHSCLRLDAPPKLQRLANAGIAALDRGEEAGSSPTLDELNDYLNTLDEACYVLKSRLENLGLRHDLLPWVEALDEWVWVGKRAMRLLEAMHGGQPFEHLARGVTRAIEDVQVHSKRTAGHTLLPFAECVLKQAAQRSLMDRALEAETFPARHAA